MTARGRDGAALLFPWVPSVARARGRWTGARPPSVGQRVPAHGELGPRAVRDGNRAPARHGYDIDSRLLGGSGCGQAARVRDGAPVAAAGTAPRVLRDLRSQPIRRTSK